MFYCIFINNIFALWDFDQTFAKNIFKKIKKDTLKFGLSKNQIATMSQKKVLTKEKMKISKKLYQKKEIFNPPIKEKYQFLVTTALKMSKYVIFFLKMAKYVIFPKNSKICKISYCM